MTVTRSRQAVCGLAVTHSPIHPVNSRSTHGGAGGLFDHPPLRSWAPLRCSPRSRGDPQIDAALAVQRLARRHSYRSRRFRCCRTRSSRSNCRAGRSSPCHMQRPCLAVELRQALLRAYPCVACVVGDEFVRMRRWERRVAAGVERPFLPVKHGRAGIGSRRPHVALLVKAECRNVVLATRAVHHLCEVRPFSPSNLARAAGGGSCPDIACVSIPRPMMELQGNPEFATSYAVHVSPSNLARPPPPGT